MACPPNEPQKAQNSKLKFSFDYFDGTPPSYTWTFLPNAVIPNNFGHTVTTVDTTDNSSGANTPSVGIRRVESDFTFSFYPQDPTLKPTEYAAQVAFEAGHEADPTGPCWLWINPSDAIALGDLACTTITSWEDTKDQDNVRMINVTVKPRWVPDQDVVEPVTVP